MHPLATDVASGLRMVSGTRLLAPAVAARWSSKFTVEVWSRLLYEEEPVQSLGPAERP